MYVPTSCSDTDITMTINFHSSNYYGYGMVVMQNEFEIFHHVPYSENYQINRNELHGNTDPDHHNPFVEVLFKYA